MNKWFQCSDPRSPDQQDWWRYWVCLLKRKKQTNNIKCIGSWLFIENKWNMVFRKVYFFLPVTEILTESLRGELNVLLEMCFSYWHWYSPLSLKSTLWILKVADLDPVSVWLKLLEVFLRVKVPSKNSDETEHVMLMFWPQLTCPSFIEMLGFGRLAEKSKQKE